MKQEIKQQSILKSGAYTMSMGLIGKVFGFVTSLLTAYLFGANSKTDVIFFTCLIVFTLSTLFSAYNSNILLPQLIKSNAIEKSKLINYSFTILFISLSFLLAFLFYFHQEFLLQFSHFKLQHLQESKLGILLLLPILLLQPVNDLMINIAQSFKNYNLSNISSLITGICNISCLILFSQNFQENSLALGFLLAAIIQTFLFYIYLFKRGLHPKFSFSKPESSSLINSLLIPTFLLQIASSFLLVLPDFFASSLEAGTLSLISYGKRIFDLIPTLFIYPIILVFYPRICEWLDNHDKSIIQKKLYHLLKSFFVFLYPCAIFFLIYSSDLIYLFFGKTNLSMQQLKVSSNCLQLFALSTPAFIIASFSGRILAASQNKLVFYLQVLGQLTGSIFLYFMILFTIKDYGYVAIMVSLLVYHLVYSQIVNLILIKKYIFSFSFFGIFSLEAIFVVTPLLIAFVTYNLKVKLSFDFKTNIAISIGTFIILTLSYWFSYYQKNKKTLLKLLEN
ncbi:MAG: hypothetical protein COB02_15700 [Candidatus Cloacimonadota bacterium]|nr:MAG: hypothetical protein COB02_15700 [Candidatus Cloacimonadota bacterium]